MLINAFSRANAQQRAQLQQWVHHPDAHPAEKVVAVTQLYNEIGVDQLAQAKINEYFQRSKQYLDAVDVDEQRKQELHQYALQMMNRAY